MATTTTTANAPAKTTTVAKAVTPTISPKVAAINALYAANPGKTSIPAPAGSNNNSGSSAGYNYPQQYLDSVANDPEAGASTWSSTPTDNSTTPAVSNATQVSSAPIQQPVTPTNTPVSTAQPSPTTVNATPYTGDSSGQTSTQTPTQTAHALATASGISAPQSAGEGKSIATQTVAKAIANQGYVAPPPVVDAYQKATEKYTNDFNNAMSSQGQDKSLVQQYQDFTNQLGIPALNTQLMNMKNIIDGTEDDVRNEVTKAGGFATDSQVLAMTNARNKTMIQNYNNLLQTRSDMQQQVQTMVGLAAQDREYMSKQIDRQLNFDQQQIDFTSKALSNAQSSIQKSIDTYGAASVMKQALATGDPTAVARINSILGNGFDLKTAAAHPTLDQQVKQANIAQSYASANSSNASAEKTRYELGQLKNPTKANSQGLEGASNSLTAIKTAMGQTNLLSAGPLANVTSWTGLNASHNNLASTIETIKSNLTKDTLLQLKAQSPTGASGFGALSDTEGRLLASSVANLDTTQGGGQLKKNLGLVHDHYVKYLTSLGYGYDDATDTIITP